MANGSVVCVPQAAEVQDLTARCDREHDGNLVGGDHHLVGQHIRGRCLVVIGEVVEQGGQLDGPGDLTVNDLRADPALAHQQALVDQFLDRPAHGGSGQAELFGQADLVVQSVTGSEIALIDGMLDLLSNLEVQRHRAGTIQVHKELHHRTSLHVVGLILVHVSPTSI